jgi:hypothetical protein
MSRLWKFMLALSIALGANALLGNSSSHFIPAIDQKARLAADGAFRDGLYLGKLAARNRLVSRPAIGRWSAPQDRAMFAAGYARGYSEARVEIKP